MLPKLPALAGAWVWSIRVVDLSAGEWTTVAPADPERWFLYVATDDANRITLSPQVDDTGLIGTVINAPGDFKVEYQKWGIVCQVEWFAICRFAIAACTVITASIPKPRG